MAKQLNVNLQMTADTGQASQQIKSLQNQLTKLINTSASRTDTLGITKDLKEGIQAATTLKAILSTSTNASGGLDLSKFNNSLKQSNVKLSEYADKLIAMGPEGSKAFNQIAHAVLNAEMPLKRTNSLLTEFATTLKNTARWQISSSLLHGFMGSLSSAYRYAQDLNESLTNIRIVTGHSTEQMAKFAQEANEAAKALSTTTTRYTNAALIFYQQGLTDDLVKEYTDITINMANVTGDGAEKVSSYMTAIWNNFNKSGEESAEHFADVLTALGAATASSTSEIAAGLEKFAAIADVTGLSYDYATAALATLVSNTRQSADVVGTSLKTIFSRLESVSLGETLDDGVNLNKYSEALKVIGVEILDASGEMKNLDDILDDTAEKWDTLTRAQQMATAQTVAGVRQYNNFISLMNNWDDMEANLDIAKNSDGTLQEQADIYAESWEAARDRVRAAAETIYQSLLEDDFFITILNGFEKILVLVDNTIEGLGGLPGVLLLVANAMMRAFGPEIAQQMQNTWYNLNYSTEAESKRLAALRAEIIQTMKSLSGFDNYSTVMADAFKISAEAQDAYILKTQEIINQGRQLSEVDKQKIQSGLDAINATRDETEAVASKILKEEELIATLKTRLAMEAGQNNYKNNIESHLNDLQKMSTANAQATRSILSLRDAMNSGKSWGDIFPDMATKIKNLQEQFSLLDVKGNKALKQLQASIMALPSSAGTTSQQMEASLDAVIQDLETLGNEAANSANRVRQYFGNATGDELKALNGILDQLIAGFVNVGELTDEQSNKLQRLRDIQSQVKQQIKETQGAQYTFSEGLVALTSSIGSLAMAITSLKSLGSIWTDEDRSVGDKILTTITTLAMVMPMLTNAFSKQNIAKILDLKLSKQKVVADMAEVKMKHFQVVATDSLTVAIWKKIAAQMVENWYYAAAVGLILAVAAAVAIYVAAINAQVNADKAAAEAAREKADSLKDAYEETQKAAEDLKTTIEDYSKAIDSIDALDKTTREYKEAIIEANEKALELLKTNKELAKYASRNDDGLIIISDEGLDALLDKQLQNVASVQLEYLKAESDSLMADLEYEISKFKRSHTTEEGKEVSNEIIYAIAKYMAKNDLSGLIPSDLDKIAEFTSATDDVRNAILSNIDDYSALGLQINDTEHAQKLLAETCREESWKLLHPDAEKDENGQYSREDRAQIAMFDTSQSEHAQLTQADKDAAAAKYRSEKMQEFIGEDGFGLREAIMMTPVYGPSGEMVAPGYDPTEMFGSDAAYYAYLKGWDTNGWTWNEDTHTMDSGTAWPRSGGWFNSGVGLNSSLLPLKWDFKDSSGTAMGSLTDEELAAAIEAEEQKILDDKQASIEVPDFLSSVDEVYKKLNFTDDGLRTLDDLILSMSSGKVNLQSANMSQAQAEYLKQNWSSVESAFEGYDDETGFWQKQGYDSAEEYLSAMEEWINARAEQSDISAIGSKFFQETQEEMSTVVSDALSGDLTSANADQHEDYLALNNQLNQLKLLYPELAAEVDIFNEKSLIGTELWAQAAEQLQDRLNKFKLDALCEEADKASEKIKTILTEKGESEWDIVLNTEDFQNEIDALLDADYAINVEIHTQAEQAFNDIETAIETMSSMAGKIGENYVVAAEDIRELNNVFPGIIEGMEAVGDGSVKLNSTVVQNAMDAAKGEMAASSQSTISQLENQAAILRGKQKTYLAMYQAALALAQGEGNADEQAAIVKQGFDELEDYNNKLVSESEMTRAAEVATDSNVQAGITAQNWNSAYQEAAKSAIEFAKVAVSANQAAQSGDLSTLQTGDFSVNYTGTNGQSSESSELATLEEAYNAAQSEEDYEELAAQFLTAAEANGKMANDIEGMIAELGALNIENGKMFDNIKDGLGKDPKDTKKTEKQKSNKELKDLDDALERYHEINDVLDDIEESLEDLSREYDKLSTQSDRAFGVAKIKLMRQQRIELQKQVDTIDKQIAAQKKLLDEEKKYLQQDKDKAQSYGWSFDNSGNVQNYDATLQKIVNEYNKVILAYNAMDAEAQQAYLKVKDAEGRDPLKQAEDRYNEALQALQKYEETREKIEDTEDTIADKEQERLEKLQEQYDLLLAEVQTEIELKISVDDSELDLLKDKLADLGDSADNALDVIANINQQVDKVVTKSETYREGINKTLDTLKDYGVSDEDLTKIKNSVADGSIQDMKPEDLQAMFSSSEIVDYASLIADLQDYSKELLAMNEEIRAYKDQVFDTMSAAFNEYLEDLERYEAKTEHAKKLTQGYKDLITSLGKANIDKDGSLTKQINEALVSESKDALREAQATQDYAQSAFDKAKAEYEKYSTQGSPWYNEEMARKWKTQMEECEDALMAAEEKTQEALQATAEAIKTAFKDTITQIMDDLDDSLGNVSYLQQQFDQAQELSDQYLDDYKKIYELSKLTRQVHKSMDETSNVKAKKLLMDYQAKINKYQQDGVKMSAYELEHLQKEYELRLAQIQLEEAQNAKSQVRMTRDSEGNYGYVYTADDSAQDDARQNYEDKLYALQELNTQYITEMQRLSLEIQAQWQETLDQILADESLTLEEQQARIAEASEFYTQRLAYVNEQLGIAVDNNRTLYENDWTKYSETTGYKISADEDYVDTWGETTLAVLTGAQDQQGYYQNVQTAFQIAVKSIQEETAKYQAALNEVGLSADALAGKISSDVEIQKQASNEAAGAAEDMSQRAQEAMGQIMDKAGEFSERWVTELEATIQKNQEYVQSINDMITALSDLQAAQNVPEPSQPDIPTPEPTDPGPSNPDQGDNGKEEAAHALATEAAEIIKGVHYGTIPQTSGGWVPSAKSMGYSENAIKIARQAFNDSKAGAGYDYCYKKALALVGYDTGGYTGDWGNSEGRLALLHSKELVLNAQDTENMLAIIDMVRQISNAIDTNALSTLMSSGLTAASVNTKEKDILEQHVTITAEFPNATDKDSILDAFDNVINLAAQYANRR